MSERFLHVLAAGLLLPTFTLVLAGCGANTAPVTAQNSKFRPATEGGTTGAPASTNAEASPASETPGAPAAPTSQSAAASRIPIGSVDDLKRHIIALAQQPGSPQEQIQVADDIIATCLKILDSKPSDEDKAWAVRTAQDIFQALESNSLPGTGAKIHRFAMNLAQRSDPDLSRQGRYLIYRLEMIDLLNKSPDDGTEVVAQAKKFAADEAADLKIQTLNELSQTAQILMQVGLRKEGLEVLNLAADTAAASKDEKVAAQASAYRDRATLNGLDFTTLVKDLISGEKEAEQKLLEGVKSAFAKVQPTEELADSMRDICNFLDMADQGRVALLILDELELLIAKSEDKPMVARVTESIGKARKRAGLVGQPFSVEGVLPDGKPFDWSAYQGKVVLVDFWATWCTPCLAEIPKIQRNYEDFRDLGFEVVGVSLDTDPAALKNFLDTQGLPWTTSVSQELLDGKLDPQEPALFATLPMAVKCGVDGIPFLVLVGKDGMVDAIHVRGEKLRTRLVALLGDPDGKPADEKPATVKPAADKPATEDPAAKPAEVKPATDTKQSALTPQSVVLAAALLAAQQPAAAAAADDPAINPYAAKPGLTTEQLASYLQKMLDKPKTIQARPGFCEAVCEAADRLMSADPPATEVQFFVAVETRFEVLHKKACTGDAATDKLLMAFVEKMKDDPRPRIARQVAFFRQERKVLDAVDGPVEEVPELLKELQAYYAKEKPAARHLRMASSTVTLINRLTDGDKREEHFGAFGKTFATSSDKELARYGKKLAKKPATTESELVGQPLELAGTTAKGANFVWDAFRGKVVLVDFWATWCGPCRREMPQVKVLYEKLHERGFDVVGVSLDQDQEALAAYLEENAIAWDTLAGDGTQELAEKYGVRGIPTMILVDKDGKIVGVAHNVAALAPLVEKLIAGAPAAAPAK